MRYGMYHKENSNRGRNRMEQIPHTKTMLQEDLKRLGILPGDTVLMHSSFRALGGVEDGAAGFFAAFLQLLGSKGTLLLPTLSYEQVTREQPVFDRQQTPSCVGYLTEYFRTAVPGTVRSMHATHSCAAYGDRAAALTAEHHLDTTPVGPHSPFAKLPQVNGKILMLGCDPDHNTSMHGVEETAEPPYLLDRAHPITYRLRDGGTETEQQALRHNFWVEGKKLDQCYGRILSLLSPEEVRYGRVLQADCVLMSAAAVWEKGHRKLLEDPWFFVQR